MKKFLLLVLALILMGYTIAEAEPPENLGVTGEELVEMFRSYLEPFGISTYAFEITERDKTASSFTMPLSKYCSLSISQADNMVTSFQIVSSENDGSEQRTEEIMACFLGCIMLSNVNISADEAINLLIDLMNGKRETTRNGIYYRYSTGMPLTSVIGLEVSLAE